MERKEVVKLTIEWIERNKEYVKVLEERHTNEFDEYFIQSEQSTVHVYISDTVHTVKNI